MPLPPVSNEYKKVVVYLAFLLLTTGLACTPADQSARSPVVTDQAPVRLPAQPGRPCRQIVWRDYNTNRYVYQFDSSQRLSQCTAFEQTNNNGMHALDQHLTYTKGGLLERVHAEEDSSRYQYRNGRLASIDFFQEGQLVYRYLVATNEQGLIVGLRGVPLNDSGLLPCATRYRLDEQGRYVQLDLEDDHGVLYYRVRQRSFVSADGHLYGQMASVPYDLNRYPWLNWAQVFPVSRYLAGHVEMFRYAAPETPTELIKRADLSVTWQRNIQGYLTGQFSTDGLTTIQDTVLIKYLNCH